LETRRFILGWLCQHAEPDGMPLVDALQGDAGPLWVTGTKPVGTPLEACHTLEGHREGLQIQGKSGDYHRAICCPTDEFYWGGIHHEFPECLLLQISKS
jgi:hypothetical protein